jgi:hypothetical protein
MLNIDDDDIMDGMYKEPVVTRFEMGGGGVPPKQLLGWQPVSGKQVRTGTSFMYVYVCMYVYIYICMYVCVRACVCVCVYVCMRSQVTWERYITSPGQEVTFHPVTPPLGVNTNKSLIMQPATHPQWQAIFAALCCEQTFWHISHTSM